MAILNLYSDEFMFIIKTNVDKFDPNFEFWTFTDLRQNKEEDEQERK